MMPKTAYRRNRYLVAITAKPEDPEFFDEWSLGLRFVRNHVTDEGLNFLRAADNKRMLALGLADLSVHKHDFIGGQALEYARESLALAETLHDDWLIAYATLGMGVSYYYNLQDADTALATLDRAEKLARINGDRFLLCMLYWSKAHVLCHIGSYTAARSAFLVQIETGQGLGNYLVGGYGLWGTSWVSDQLGDFAMGQKYQALRLAAEQAVGNTHGIMGSLGGLGYSYWRMADYANATVCFKEQSHLAETHGWTDALVHSKIDLAMIALDQGLYDEAATRFAQLRTRLPILYESGIPSWVSSLYGEYALRTGDLAGAGTFLTIARAACDDAGEEPSPHLSIILGRLARYQGDLWAAQALIEPWIAHRGWFGSVEDSRSAQLELPFVLVAKGDSDAAAALQRAITTFRLLSTPLEIARLLEGSADMCVQLAHPAAATRLMAAAATLREQIGAPMWPVDRPAHAQLLAACRTALGDAAFDAAWAAGAALTWEQAADAVLAWLQEQADN